MTLSGAGDCDEVAAGGLATSSTTGSLDADGGWIARVQDTAARFNDSHEVTQEQRDVTSARLEAVMGRYHQFMGVDSRAEEVAGGGNAAVGETGEGTVSF